MFDIIEFSNQLQDLIIENRELRRENIRLSKVEEDFHNFLNERIESHNQFIGETLNTLVLNLIKDDRR